jgi:hypothetical protein
MVKSYERHTHDRNKRISMIQKKEIENALIQVD